MIMEFKKSFLQHYSKLTDVNEFKNICLTPLRKSIRINTLKITVSQFMKRTDLELSGIPWCKDGFFVKNKISLGNLRDHSLGYFYVQEAASMIPPLVLNPKEDDLVLDMAAAPGSKTTQMAAMMKNRGLIVANDYKYERIKSLGLNIQRCGVTNTVITLQHGRFFKDLRFNKILVDAPCSATGNIRRSLNTLKSWNLNVVKRLAGSQKQLLSTAFKNLDDGGTLVYSTCSLEPEENESVVDYLISNYGAKLESIKIDVKKSDPVLSYEGISFDQQIKKCLRLWPQDNDSEGFFVAKIKK